MAALNKKYSATLCVCAEVCTPTEIICLKTSASDEQKADGSIFLFGVSNKKILSQP